MKHSCYSFKFHFLWILYFFPLAAFAQIPISIQGKVTDNRGEPLIGVSIQLAKTTVGSTTDVDGNYSFSGNVPGGNYNLVFTYIGFLNRSRPITVSEANNSFTENIILEPDVLSLNEVVVIGSTVSQEKKQLGNTITSIKSDQITGRGTGDPLQSLQGKVAGAQITQNSGDPAGGISVKLRGAKSILSSSEPLYVIDGVVVSNATRNVTNVNIDAGSATPSIGQNRLADINPNDIESIEVINGAAAAALYGSRASNGVVLITTKRGKAGQMKINFSTAFNINELRKKVPISTYPFQFGSAALRLNTIGDSDPNTPGTQLATNLVDVGKRFDYQDAIFRTGYGTDNNLSISGGNEKTRYFASANFLKNQGIVVNSDFRRVGGG